MAEQQSGGSEPEARAQERAVIIATLSALAEPLAALIPGECEVVVHDLSLLPNSIVAIAGGLTGRTVGGPATDKLLRDSAAGTFGTQLGYATDAGRGAIRGSTIIARDGAGDAVAALCVNNATESWRIMEEVARAMLPWTRLDALEGRGEEAFPRDVDELAQQVLAQAISASEVPVELMQKRHKLAVVQALMDRGFFLLKESVETAAQALGVTRFTVYNYLNELGANGRDA